jgi:predicted PurR-regulated permease PerM
MISKKMKYLLIVFWLIFLPVVAYAIEVAPRLSDREIIESLSELKSGQNNLEKVMNQRFEQVNQRFQAMEKTMNQRFEQVNQRFQAMEKNIDTRFQSFEKRFSFLENLMMIAISGIFGLIGYIVWDRKTARKNPILLV